MLATTHTPLQASPQHGTYEGPTPAEGDYHDVLERPAVGPGGGVHPAPTAAGRVAPHSTPNRNRATTMYVCNYRSAEGKPCFNKVAGTEAHGFCRGHACPHPDCSTPKRSRATHCPDHTATAATPQRLTTTTRELPAVAETSTGALLDSFDSIGPCHWPHLCRAAGR